MARLNKAKDLRSIPSPPRTRQRRINKAKEESSVPPRRQQRKQQSNVQKSRQQSEESKNREDQSEQPVSPQDGQKSRQQSQDPPEHQSEQLQDETSDQESERQPELSAQAVTDDAQEKDVVPLNPSSSPTRHGLTIEAGSRLDLEAAFNHTDLDEFLATSDLEHALDLGQKIIIGRSQIADTVTSQCAWDISVVWKGIDRFGTTHAHALPAIQTWRENVATQLANDSKGIDHYLRLAEKTLRQMTHYGKRIFHQWGILPTQVLPKDKYSEDRPLSRSSLQAMAELADLASREESQKMLTDIIERRNQQSTRALYERHDPHLCSADIRNAIATAAKRPKKRSHEDVGSDGESGVDSGDSAVGLRPAKRSKGRSRCPKTAEDTAEADTSDDMSIELPREAPDSVPDRGSPELPLWRFSPEAFTPSAPSAPIDGSKNRQQLLSPVSPPFQAEEDPVLLLDDDDPVILDCGHSATGQQSVLATLDPKSKLSSTAIDESLKASAPQHCHIIHPLYFDPAFGDRKGGLKPLSGEIDRIFMPMHDAQRGHWTLAVIAVKEASIDVYDSLTHPRLDELLVSRLEGFAQGRAPQLKAWRTRLASCPQQSNGYDCGVHVIANAFFLMTDIPLPETHDCDAWRLVCHALVSNCTDNLKLDDLLHFQDADSEHALLRPGDEDEDPLAIRTTVHLVQKQRSKMQTQKEKFQALQTSATAIMKVMEDLRGKRRLESLDTAQQLWKGQEHSSKHATFIDDYSQLPAEYRNPDALAAMQSTQAANKQKLDRLLLQKQSAHANILKATDMVGVAKHIVRWYDDQSSKLESAMERYLGTARERYDRMRDALRELEETLEF